MPASSILGAEMITLRLQEAGRTVLERPLAFSAIDLVAEPLNAWVRLARAQGRVPRTVLIQGDVIRIIRLP